MSPLIGMTLLSGCIFAVPRNPSPPAAAPAASLDAPQMPAALLDELETPGAGPVATFVVPAGSQRTAVVVSDDIPEFLEVADEILQRGANVTVHQLSGQQDNAARVIAEIEAMNPDRIIAIGLLAAIVAHEIPETPIVFCQAYNYHGLLSPMSKGVYLLPPFDLQLEAWRELSQDLRRIGVLTGPHQDALIAEIREAAAPFGIEVSVHTVQSDWEALFAFKQLAPEIQGLWLLPDNRILSPDVIREIMAYSAKHRKQVAVFGDNLLDLGALLSVTNDPRDVVDRVFARLDDIDENGQLLGPDMLQLTSMQLDVNKLVAAHLGLVVPLQLADAH